MNLKYLYVVVFSTAVYMIYYSDNFYVEFAKQYIATNLKNVYKFKSTQTSTNGGSVLKDGIKIFTSDELSKFSNVESGLYLSILGKIYDVTNGAKFYGPGGTYNGFVGRDASLAFITGDFNDEGLTDDVSSLSDKQIIQLKDWASFYDKNYIYKGKLMGRYYDKNGKPTKEYKNIIKIIKRGKQLKIKEEQKNAMFPPCNIEWKADEGTRVWCTNNSGGVSRNWIGVPRILFEKPNSKQNRCACVNVNSEEYLDNQQNIGMYEGCPISATSCIINNSKQTN